MVASNNSSIPSVDLRPHPQTARCLEFMAAVEYLWQAWDAFVPSLPEDLKHELDAVNTAFKSLEGSLRDVELNLPIARSGLVALPPAIQDAAELSWNDARAALGQVATFANRPEIVPGVIVFCKGGSDIGQVVDRQDDAVILAPVFDTDPNSDGIPEDLTKRFTWHLDQLIVLPTALPLPVAK